MPEAKLRLHRILLPLKIAVCVITPLILPTPMSTTPVPRCLTPGVIPATSMVAQVRLARMTKPTHRICQLTKIVAFVTYPAPLRRRCSVMRALWTIVRHATTVTPRRQPLNRQIICQRQKTARFVITLRLSPAPRLITGVSWITAAPAIMA